MLHTFEMHSNLSLLGEVELHLPLLQEVTVACPHWGLDQVINDTSAFRGEVLYDLEVIEHGIPLPPDFSIGHDFIAGVD